MSIYLVVNEDFDKSRKAIRRYVTIASFVAARHARSNYSAEHRTPKLGTISTPRNTMRLYIISYKMSKCP